MRRVVFAFALVLLASLSSSCHRRGSDLANFPPIARGPWVAFGDSLTEGVGASPGHDYPSLLAGKLGVPIRNMGRSGETSSDALNRLEEVMRLRPRVVLLCFGGNDSLQGQPADVTFANLARIVDELQQTGSFVMLIGVHSASLRDKREGYYAKLAKEKRLLYMPDILSGILFRPIYMSDQIHPNDAGYEKIAERLADLLRPFLPEIGST